MKKYTPTAARLITYVLASLLPSMALGITMAIANAQLTQAGEFAALYYAPLWIILIFFLTCGLIPVLIKTESRFNAAIKCLWGASALIALLGVLSL